MGRIPILMYHSVSTVREGMLAPYTLSPKTFEAHLAHLVGNGYRTYTVPRLLEALAAGALHERSVAVTFDDGLADFHQHALPMLVRYGVASTLYVPTADIGGTVGWLRKHPADRRQMLTSEQLRDVHAHGVECGAHSHTHPQLDLLRADAVTAEMRRSREVLEDLLGTRVDSFAYPFGYHRRATRNAVRAAGFRSACAVGHLVADESLDRFAVPRLIVSDTTSVAELQLLLQQRTPSPADRALVRAKDLTWRSTRRFLRRTSGTNRCEAARLTHYLTPSDMSPIT
ncbi:MAG TPA: polysaccharide deacetylase family protein [Solirubrobacteraceae bacterium]|jgi:peptidoglycan/xylan/chitin deacetylase (PgdA/CDA1 family)|nr:polysaccharide deacetylase family protein [Solirubrobacteraceae bacterium]